MSDTVPWSSPSLSLQHKREIDDICDRFERAWQAGERPRIDQFVGATPEPMRAALLDELRKVDDCYQAQHRQPSSPVLPQLPGYEVIEEIGRGGMGVVYKARQLSVKRTVAIKMILAGRLADEEAVKRFRAEAEAAGKLRHENIVVIHEVHEFQGQHYFSMDYIEGESFAAVLQKGPLPPRQAAGYVRIVAEAIQHAHDQGILHRDLKPANILLNANDQPRVTDFGLAKRLDGQATQTQSGIVLGTPGYMAPEQAAGHANRQTPLTDVYGLGALLYALLTGRPPFQAPGPLDLIDDILHRPAVLPINRQIDADLETICLKCLEKEPSLRYESAQALADDLDSYLRNRPIKASPPSHMQKIVRVVTKRDVKFDARLWSNLSFFGAGLGSLAHLAMFFILQTPHTALLFWLCLAIHWVIASVVVARTLARSRQPLTLDERDIIAIWSAYCLSTLVLCLIAYPWDRNDILAIYPALAILLGLYCLVLAGLYWGQKYVYGLACFALAAVMRLTPDWSPLEFAGFHALMHTVHGLVLRRHANAELAATALPKKVER